MKDGELELAPLFYDVLLHRAGDYELSYYDWSKNERNVKCDRSLLSRVITHHPNFMVSCSNPAILHYKTSHTEHSNDYRIYKLIEKSEY